MLVKHLCSAYTCIEENCNKKGMSGFANEKELNNHIKETHPSSFQCSFPGGDRIGTKGWMRKRDMVKHMVKKHGQEVIGNNH